jgi:hypothetical protein
MYFDFVKGCTHSSDLPNCISFFGFDLVPEFIGITCHCVLDSRLDLLIVRRLRRLCQNPSATPCVAITALTVVSTTREHQLLLSGVSGSTRERLGWRGPTHRS